MASPPTRRVRRRCWRILAPKWAGAPLSGAGAARNGGRYNEPGVETLYLSLDLMTAVAEYLQDLGPRPGTFCAYDVDVRGVVDLTDPAVRRACRASMTTLHGPWKKILLIDGKRPPTWTLARRLRNGGAAGLLVPSTQHAEGVNLVLWRWNDTARRRVTAIDPHSDLPADQSSWPR